MVSGSPRARLQRSSYIEARVNTPSLFARDSPSTYVDGIPPPSHLEIIRKSFRRVIGITREMRSETLRVSSSSLLRSFYSVMLVVVFFIVLFTAVSRFQFRKTNNAGGRKNGQS